MTVDQKYKTKNHKQGVVKKCGAAQTNLAIVGSIKWMMLIPVILELGMSGEIGLRPLSC